MAEIDLTGVTEAWLHASTELGFQVVAPYIFDIDGRQHHCVARVPHFGGPTGAIVTAIGTPAGEYGGACYRDAKQQGYYWSSINVKSYGHFDREAFIEMLADWGYFGAAAERPSWLKALTS
ncbi:MAG: hypothetical protein ACHREM_23035 [Polyangiales bacterium]